MNLSGLCRSFRFWWQRITRGWDDSETWSLDHSLAEFLAPRLRRLSELTHGSPSGYPDKSPAWDAETDHEAWRQDLVAASDAFAEYAEYMDCSDATDDWSMEREESAYKEAKRTMEWVAEWFGSLWD